MDTQDQGRSLPWVLLFLEADQLLSKVFLYGKTSGFLNTQWREFSSPENGESATGWLSGGEVGKKKKIHQDIYLPFL